MAPTQFFARVFSVRPGEGRILIALLIHSLFLGIGITFFYSAASAFFLVNFDVKSLPYAYIGSAIVAPAISLLFSKLEQKVPAIQLFNITLGFLFVSICLFRLVLAISDSRWPVFLFFVWSNVLLVLCHLEFWGLAGKCFNVRQGKRLFSLIGAGEVSAYVIGGLTVPAIVATVGTPNLLVGSAAGTGLCLVVLAFIHRSFPNQFEEKNKKAEKQKAGEGQSFRDFLKNRYTVLIFILWTVSVFGFYFIDFAFYQQVETRYTTKDQLAGFFGVFFAVAGIADLLSRIFVSGPLVNRFGLTAGLLALPMLLTFGGGSMIVGYLTAGAGTLFWLVVMTRTFDKVFRSSIEEPSKRILYQPLPIDKRLKFQTSVEGLVEPIAGGLAGAGLLLLTNLMDFKTLHAASFLICIGGVWIAVILALSKEYKQTLLEAISRRTFSADAIKNMDRDSTRILEQGLKSRHPGEVVYCLNVLESLSHERYPDFLEELLAHPVPEVRVEVLRRLEKNKFVQALDSVRQRVKLEIVPEVLGAALRTLTALDSREVFETVLPFLEDSNPKIRMASIVAILRSDSQEKFLAIGEFIGLERSPKMEHRKFTAQLLGETDREDFYEPLLVLLEDKEPQVRRAALIASGKIKNSHLWTLILKNLHDKKVHAIAYQVLTQLGEPLVPFLEIALDQAREARDVQLKIIPLLGHIRGAYAVQILKDYLNYPHLQIRHETIRSLQLCGYKSKSPGEALLLIQNEIETAHWNLNYIQGLSESIENRFLYFGLKNELDKNQESLLFLLSFLYPKKTLMMAYESLIVGHGEKQAYAFEVLDTLVDKDLRKEIIPLLEKIAAISVPKWGEKKPPSPESQTLFQKKMQDVIIRPLDRIYPVTKAYALYTLGWLGSGEFTSALKSAADSSEPLIRETSAWALSQTKSPEEAATGEVFPLGEPVGGKKRGTAKPVCFPFKERVQGNMLLTIEKAIILKATEFFCETPADVLAAVAEIVREEKFNKGETIFNKGDFGRSLYIVVQGTVRVQDGERILARLGEKEVFGELAALDPEPRSATIIAEEETLLLCLEHDVVYDLMIEKVGIAQGIIRFLCRRVRKK